MDIPASRMGWSMRVPLYPKFDHDPCAATRFAVDARTSARLLNETIDLAQPETRTLADRLGREERFKCASCDLFAHSLPVVCHFDGNTGRQVPLQDRTRRHHHDTTGFFHGIGRVGYQIEQC